MASERTNKQRLELLNAQLRAIDAVPLLSDDAAGMFTDDELRVPVELSKKHLMRIHKLLAERNK